VLKPFAMSQKYSTKGLKCEMYDIKWDQKDNNNVYSCTNIKLLQKRTSSKGGF